MALPATDNFNRAGPALGANWTGSVGSDLVISASTVVTGNTAVDNSMYWNADAPDAAQYAQVKVATYNATQYTGPIVRASNSDWVLLDIYTQWQIEWFNAGDWTVIGTAYSSTPVVNDVGKISANGTTFKGYVNGTERISGTNAFAPSTGYGGMYVYSTSGAIDDFEVGNLAAPPATVTYQTLALCGVGPVTR